MIVVSGNPLNASEISGQYSGSAVEKQILERMSQSTATYRFDNLEQLNFELALRREIVNAAGELSRSGLKFAVFHESKCNPQYFDRTGNGGIRLNSGVKPSDAIRDIFKNGRKYATECATAMVIVYYGALLALLSEETFNSLFPSIYLMNWHGLDPLLRAAGSPQKVADILPGDRCYFKNPEVDPKTPELHGENVVVLTNGLYYGHGIGIATADRIIRELNTSRKEGATRSAYFVEGYAAYPNFKKLMEASQASSAAEPSLLSLSPLPQPV